MQTGEDGIRVMHHFESCRLKAYPDPATGGAPWTIGWGHTGADVFPGLEISKEQADQWFAERLAREFEPGVEAKLRRLPTQRQFDAMVCLAYNIGVANFQRSTLLVLFNRADFFGAAAQFEAWRFASGKELLGLKRRRRAESLVFGGIPAAEAIRQAMEIQR